MTTRANRFQADIDPSTGLFASGFIYDELMAEDPITQVMSGTGRLIGPFPITDKTDPELFAALNAQAAENAVRLNAARAEHAAEVARKVADVQARATAAVEVAVEEKP